MAQKTPYIGCTISLVSKLDIRYEGVLYTVNSAEKTISLAKVRSFGTEDRPTARPVIGCEDVYEFIVFKAADIKDLVVCETPKPSVSQVGGLPSDPAIVSFSQHRNQTPIQLSSSVNSAGSRSSGQQNSGVHGRDREWIHGKQLAGQTPRGQMNLGQRHPMDKFDNQNSRNVQNPPNRINFESDYDFETANKQFRGLTLKEKEDQENKDKEKAINEGNVSAEIGQVNTDAKGTEDGSKKPAAFYDMKKSFFDSISCESHEKEAGKNTRPNWKNERQTNEQTFGHSAVRSLAFRHGVGRNRGSLAYRMSTDRFAGRRLPGFQIFEQQRFVRNMPMHMNIGASRMHVY